MAVASCTPDSTPSLHLPRLLGHAEVHTTGPSLPPAQTDRRRTWCSDIITVTPPDARRASKSTTLAAFVESSPAGHAGGGHRLAGRGRPEPRCFSRRAAERAEQNPVHARREAWRLPPQLWLTSCGLIKKQHPWAGQKLGCNADTALLTARETPKKGVADVRVCHLQHEVAKLWGQSPVSFRWATGDSWQCGGESVTETS